MCTMHYDGESSNLSTIWLLFYCFHALLFWLTKPIWRSMLCARNFQLLSLVVIATYCYIRINSITCLPTHKYFFSVLFLFRCTKQTTQINLHVACIQMNFSLNAARLHSINTANAMKPMLWKKWHYLKDLPFIRQPLISDNLMTPAMRYYRNNHK